MGRTWADFFRRWIFSEERQLAALTEQLCLRSFIEGLLVWIKQTMDCANVVWLRADELRYLKSVGGREMDHEPDQWLHREVKICGLKPIEDLTVAQRLLPFDVESLALQTVIDKGVAHHLVPLCDPRNNELLAAVLILGAPSHARRRLQRISRGIAALAKHARFCLEHWQARSETLHDDLTGLYNQKFMTEVIENEIARAARSRGRFSVLFIDIDHFKSVNDHHGHLVGSKMLIELGRVIKRHLRKSDYAFRYGGDEFVVVLPDASVDNGRLAAERLRRTIESTDFLIDGVHLRVTISIGIAGYPEHASSRQDVIRIADAAMYCGKQNRNAVYVANS